jgi:hypothetical protein
MLHPILSFVRVVFDLSASDNAMAPLSPIRLSVWSECNGVVHERSGRLVQEQAEEEVGNARRSERQ